MIAPRCAICDDTRECQGCAGVGTWHTIVCTECDGTGECPHCRLRIHVVKSGKTRKTKEDTTP